MEQLISFDEVSEPVNYAQMQAYLDSEYDAMSMVISALARSNRQKAREELAKSRENRKSDVGMPSKHAKAVEKRKKRKRGGHK